MVVAHHAAHQTDIIRSKELSAAVADALFHADVNSVRAAVCWQVADQHGVERMNSLNDGNLMVAKHHLPAVRVGHMLLKIKNRHFAAAAADKLRQAFADFGNIERLQAFVVMPAVRQNGGKTFAKVEIIERNTDAANTDLLQCRFQQMGRCGLAAAGRSRKHDEPTGLPFRRDSFRNCGDVGAVGGLGPLHKSGGVAAHGAVDFFRAVAVGNIISGRFLHKIASPVLSDSAFPHTGQYIHTDI